MSQVNFRGSQIGSTQGSRKGGVPAQGSSRRRARSQKSSKRILRSNRSQRGSVEELQLQRSKKSSNSSLHSRRSQRGSVEEPQLQRIQKSSKRSLRSSWSQRGFEEAAPKGARGALREPPLQEGQNGPQMRVTYYWCLHVLINDRRILQWRNTLRQLKAFNSLAFGSTEVSNSVSITPWPSRSGVFS